MKEFKGTPGPLTLDEFDNVVHGKSPSHGWGRKETVRVSGVALTGRVTEEYAANTRLVAAAQELLDALQFIINDCSRMIPKCAEDKARSAIKKALGEKQ